MDTDRLAQLRRLLHNIVVSEIDANWDLFWRHAKAYLRRARARAILEDKYEFRYKRVEYNAEGKSPFIDIFAILLRKDCRNAVPVGVEVKATRWLNKKQIAEEVERLPYFMAENYLKRDMVVKRLLANRCGGKAPPSNKRVYILIVPRAIVKEVDELIQTVKQELEKSGRVTASFSDLAFVHTVIPLEEVLDWLNIKTNLEELLNAWDLIPRV
jgi:hypothetical protein